MDRMGKMERDGGRDGWMMARWMDGWKEIDGWI